MKRELFNLDWLFALKEIGGLPCDDEFKSVDVPHDWLIFNTNALYADGDGWYKKRFTLNDIEGKLYILRFEGVYMDSEVFLNGKKIYEWKYGYTTFDVILDGVVEGENEIEVVVHHKSPNTRWYSGAGIFRNVWLTECEGSRIVPDGTYFCASCVSGSEWSVTVDTEVTGEGEAVVRHTISDAEGGIVETIEKSCVLTDEVSRVSQSFNLDGVHVWDINDPYLYTLKTELIKDGRAVYEICERVGFKTVEFTNNDGFFLNGRAVKLHGACMHHDMGALGSAVNKNAVRRQLEKLKDMGVNAIRTSHNPPSVELMELADEMGIMIDSEAFDMWELKKTDYDYARFFPEWHERDVRSWIRRDRNHVSVIMWSIGNEIYDTHASAHGVELTDELTRCVRIDDYNSLHPITIGSNYMQWEGAQNCGEHIDAVGYNYAERLYDEHHEKHPDWVIYGSETASTIQSRGTYHFPAEKLTTTHDDHQCSSLLNCATGWGSPSVEYNITQDRNHKFCLGQFIWTGWDYIGEPTPYWTKNSYFGHIDTAGFPKDSFYAYKAEWNDKAKPFVHLFPYWDFNEGQLIDLFIFSNCSRTELFLNGRSLGDYVHNHTDGDELTGRWQVPYEKGEIEAVGYDEKGNIVCCETRHSFGDAAEISLKPNKSELKADGEDLIFIEISMLDKDGYTVENDRSRVNIEVEGAARLVGTDNGDSTDYDQYKESQRKLFNGRLIAIIAAKDYAGEITVRAQSVGLPEKVIKLLAVPAEKRNGICCAVENYQSERSREIPVRKLELKVSSQTLTPDCAVAEATVEILPKISTYSLDDVCFKAISHSGVETNLVKIEKKDGKAIITPTGDGEYRIRAYCKNGTPYEEIISEIEMKNSGFGLASFDPYTDVVCASLCSETNEPLQDVFEGGLQTLHGKDTYLTFKNVDFGKVGSDTLVMGIYSYNSGPIPFELIDDDGNVLESLTYQHQSVWNHYMYNTFKLSRKYTGVMNITILFHEQLRYKGFKFIKSDRVGEEISALDNSGIYGDSFTLCSDSIKEIGNNVTIEFTDFDFGEDGISAVEIKGRSHNANDTIHVRFTGESGQDNQIVEFVGTDEPVTRRFELNKVVGKQDAKLVFLPGCKFDLYSIKFIK